MRVVEKVSVIISFVVMVTLNALANILPINGIGTGAISDSYPNLFAPAGFTFAIWGVIYLLLLVMGVYLAFKPAVSFRGFEQESRQFSWLFVISSIANSIWILAWHYRFILLSLVLMLVILACLIRMMALVNTFKWPLSQLAFVKPAIGVYFGWITVATVANVTTYLVSIAWNGFGLSEPVWLMAILAVATTIAFFAIGWSRCSGYGLVILWAYWGILSKHLSPDGFNGVYPEVMVVLGVAMIVILYKTSVIAMKTLKTLK